MSLTTYTRASRFPMERGGQSDSSTASSSSLVTPPTIDLTATETSLLLRCDHPAAVTVFVSGNPLPAVTWFVGSRRIPEDSTEFRASGGGGGGGAGEDGGRKRILSIARVTTELEDGIRLEAVNCAGSDRIRINVKTYKFLTGRSSSELTRSATLPPSLLRHRFQSENSEREFREVKSLAKDKSQNRFQMTEEDYENWAKEMESRSHMRSIDDIIDSLSDEEEEEESDETPNPEKEIKTKSCDDIFPPPTDKNQPLPPPPPPPPPPPSESNECKSLNTPVSPHNSGATDSQQLKPVEPVPSLGLHTVPECNSASSLPDCYVKMIYKDSANKADDDNYRGPLHDAPIWELFGVKLSEFCRNILSVNGGRRHEGGLSQMTRESENDYSQSGICVRSVPVERKYLGSRPSNSQVGSRVYPEMAKKQRIEKDLARGAAGASRGDARNSVPAGEKRPPMSRPPLAPKPSFSEVRVANRVTASPSAQRPFSADAVKRSTSLPKNSAATDGSVRDFQQNRSDRVSIEDNTPLPARLPPSGKGSSEEKNQISADKSFFDPGSIPDDHKSTPKCPKTAKVEETHFDCSPEDVRKYQIPQKNTQAETSRTIDDTEAKSSGEQVSSKPRKEPVSRKPPVAKDKPFWRPTARTKAPMIVIEDQTKNPPDFSEKPMIPVRRVRSQSSGKTGEEPSDFAGLASGSTSARQLSQGQKTNSEPQEDGAGKIQLSAATRSEGLLTARKLTLLAPCPPSGQEERREWRSCVLPSSRSVDVLNSSRVLQGTPKIGRRSLSKEWKVVTVTTKEEIVILRRPHQDTIKPTLTSSSSSSSSTNPENKTTWKLPLGPGRPFAV